MALPNEYRLSSFLKDDFKNIFLGPFHLTVTCLRLFA